MVDKPTQGKLNELLRDALAEVRGVGRAEIDVAIDGAGGDLVIDSKEGEAVAVIVEDELGLGELVQGADLEPEELSSISALTQLFENVSASRSRRFERSELDADRVRAHISRERGSKR